MAAAALILLPACTPDGSRPAPAPPPKPDSVLVPDVEQADLRAGYRAMADAGFDVTWNRAFWKSSSFLRRITRYARGVGPKPPYSWILEIRSRPGTEVEPGAEVTIMHVTCPTDRLRGPCVLAERDGRPDEPDDMTREVVADCFHGSVRPHRMTLACADNGFRARRLVWSHWGRRRAVGEGIFLMNDCDPGCAARTFHRRTGRILLSDPRVCEELNAYAFMSGTVVFDEPFQGRTFDAIDPGCPF